MNRAVTVMVFTLTFAILGLVVGHFCASALRTDGGTMRDAMGTVIPLPGKPPHVDTILTCYLAPPVVGALMGFVVSVVAMHIFAPATGGTDAARPV